MSLGKKRRRTSVIRRTTVRPIDKRLVALNNDGVAATQVNVSMYSATFPGTITGLRWDLEMHQDAGTAGAICHWAIVVVRDGITAPSNVAISSAAAFYEPEQDCLAFGVGSIDNNVQSIHFSGSTKTMRKMQGGDQLFFVILGTATNTMLLRGIVQFFIKS